MDFGKKLKRLMRDKGLNTRQIAEFCGVSQGAVGNWFVTGTISKDNLAKFAQRVGTTTDRLITMDYEDIVEAQEREAQAAGRAPHIGVITGAGISAARHTLERRTYTPEALELAWLFDTLADEKLRQRAMAYVENLAAGNPRVAAAERVAAPPPQPSTAPRRTSGKPTPKPRPSR